MAAVLLMSPDWPWPDVQWCYRRPDGWSAGGSGSGGILWKLTDEDRDLGVLVSWGEADEGAVELDVTFHGVTQAVAITNGFYVWMVEGVAEAEISDPAEFRFR